MNILQICSAFNQSYLYLELFNKLDILGSKESVYCSSRSIKSKIDFSKLSENINYKISYNLSFKDKFFFINRINKTTIDVEKYFDIYKFDLMHAHYLYTDGFVALNLYKKYGIDYIVTVRNTDINEHHKFRPYLRKFFYEIINNAQKIIFISPSYLDKFLGLVKDNQNYSAIKKKSIVIENAINKFWIDNLNNQVKQIDKKVRFLFIGDLNKNKNILNILKTFVQFKYPFEWELNIIGPDKGILRKIENYITMYDNINYHGVVYEKDLLLNFYRNNDIFIMPSFNETFGLVYIEALSQGLPVICSKNEGIDGLFDQNYIYETVLPYSTSSIYNAIINLVQRYNEIQQYTHKEASKFSWEIKGKQMYKIYNDIQETRSV